MARVELMCRMTEIFKDPLLSDATCQAWERFVRFNKCVRDSGSMQDGHSARCVSARNLFPGRVICGTCVCFTGPSRAKHWYVDGRRCWYLQIRHFIDFGPVWSLILHQALLTGFTPCGSGHVVQICRQDNPEVWKWIWTCRNWRLGRSEDGERWKHDFFSGWVVSWFLLFSLVQIGYFKMVPHTTVDGPWS